MDTLAERPRMRTTARRAARRRPGLPEGAWIALLAAATLGLLLADIALGPVRIPLSDVVRAVLGMDVDSAAMANIVEKIRVPKAVTALLAGCALSVSGLLMQTLFRNPLAGPDVLGITSGASLGVSLVLLATGSVPGVQAMKQAGILGGWILVAAASLGSALVLALVLAISFKVRDNASLMIIGIMMGALTISMVSLLLYLSTPEQIQDYLMWTFGSIGGVTGTPLLTFAIAVGAGVLLALSASKPLNILLLGENYARSLGLSVTRSRILILAATSLLSGAVTAFCGPIGFVGLAVPHLCRALLRTSDHLRLIAASSLLGCAVILACDIVSQLPGSRALMPLNVMTAMVGAPVVLWVIARRGHRKGFF